jgi:membrane protein
MPLKKIKRVLIGSALAQSVITKTKDAYIPGFGGFSLFDIWKAFRLQLKKTSLLERASAISYNIVMAIPPTLVFVFTLIPYLPISNQFIRELYGVIRDVVPGEENNTVIIQFLEDFLKQPRNGLLSIGLLLALFFSSNAMMGIIRSFDKDYEGFEKRNRLKKRQTALMLTIVCFVLFFIFLLLLVAQGAVLHWIGIRSSALRVVIVNVRWLIILLLLFYIISIIYRHGPSVTKKWSFISPGSVFATSLMLLATFLFSFYVDNFNNYNKLYGSISAIFILMTLIFVNALVVLMGFELNVALYNLKRQKETPGITTSLQMPNDHFLT